MSNTADAQTGGCTESEGTDPRDGLILPTLNRFPQLKNDSRAFFLPFSLIIAAMICGCPVWKMAAGKN